MTGLFDVDQRPAMLPSAGETRVITLKGRLHEFGPRLQHAPAGLLYVGRACCRGRNNGSWDLQQSKFANRHSVKKQGIAGALARFVQDVIDHPELVEEIREHTGGIFGCWCGNDAGITECHAAIWAFVADGGDPRDLPTQHGILFANERVGRRVDTVRLRPETAVLL